jgi:N-carbamoylputrescine amidase
MAIRLQKSVVAQSNTPLSTPDAFLVSNSDAIIGEPSPTCIPTGTRCMMRYSISFSCSEEGGEEKMKVTVCELPDDRQAFVPAWEALIAYVREQQSELVLLPELPFTAWFVRTPQFDAEIWRKAKAEHDLMMNALSALAPATVLGTHLQVEGERHLNRGFVWTAAEGYKGVHDKYYFPDEEDFYERQWFDRNQRDFTLAHVEDLAIGFLICTEVMFNEWARSYGRQGANIIAVPRASSSHERWELAPRMAAVVAGAFVISSNRVDENTFAGRGLIVGPNGEMLASTSRQAPFATVDINLRESHQAKKTYPRDVPE